MRNFYQKVKNGFNYVKKNVVKVACFGVSAVVVVSSVCKSVFAQGLDLTGVAVDTTPVFTISLIVITGLASIWAIHKVIGLIRAR
ncbi:MAG: hypothetical protein H8D23_04705 [Candidatus Brocadiales bacterium]|nr:hypothetical protein [Candidatus Brocadiales bacterium]